MDSPVFKFPGHEVARHCSPPKHGIDVWVRKLSGFGRQPHVSVSCDNILPRLSAIVWKSVEPHVTCGGDMSSGTLDAASPGLHLTSCLFAVKEAKCHLRLGVPCHQSCWDNWPCLLYWWLLCFPLPSNANSSSSKKHLWVFFNDIFIHGKIFHLWLMVHFCSS